MAQTMANTRFSDIVLDDANLSMSAKGVFVTIGFLGNGCTFEGLARHASEDVEAVKAAAQELISAGYVTTEEDDKLFIKTAPSFGILG
ncbi:hypothetical protein BH24DEI2_BH24DEI2_09180 [soil metagenome]